MTDKYIKVVEMLESGSVSASINSYESLPTRNSPRTLVSAPPKKDSEDKQYEDKTGYPFETLDTMSKKLSPKKD